MYKTLWSGLILGFIVFSNFQLSQASTNQELVKFLVNEKELTELSSIYQGDSLYIPFRKLVNTIGIKIRYDAEIGLMTVLNQKNEIISRPSDTIRQYNGFFYYEDEALPLFNGQLYLPLPLIEDFIKYSASFNKKSNTVILEPYGYGQELAIKELLLNYYGSFNPKYLTDDNYQRRYYTEYDYKLEPPVSEIPIRQLDIKIDHIHFTSENEATLLITYIKQTEVLERTDIYTVKIRFEKGNWRISEENWLFNSMALPEDINEKAESIRFNRQKEQKSILEDLNTYYTAYNTENLKLLTEYTAPSFIKTWNDSHLDPESWEDFMKVILADSHTRYILKSTRVIFIGEKEAVVEGILEMIDDGEIYEYNLLINMDYANGHWTYSHETDLNQDFDNREESNLEYLK